MKKYTLLSVSLLALLAACNDDYNDKFDISHEFTDVKEITMTLTESDYATIAGNETNKAIALAKDPEGKTGLTALEAVGKNKCFSTEATAEDYLPAFIGDKYPNADLKSKFTINYNMYQAPAAYLSEFSNISVYQLTEEDYEAVWGDKVKASYLSPQTLSRIPSLLTDAVEDAKEGDMVTVNYAYSDVEPSIGGGGEVDPYTKISDVLAQGEGVESTVKAEIVATYARGMLISDGTATILVYLNAMPNYAVGDIVEVTGTTTKYSGLLQFPNSSVVTRLEHNPEFKFPATSTVMSGAELDNYVNNPDIKYVTFTGDLTISGNYYNIVVDGMTRQGSISYPVAGLVNPDLNGKKVDVTGYLIGGSSKYVNVMAVSVTEAGVADEYTPVGIIALSDAGTYKAKGVVAEIYKRGFLLTDGTGAILVYLNAAHEYVVGDAVVVSGPTSAYAGLKQFTNKSEVSKIASTSFKYPAPRALATADMEAYLTAPYAGYVTYTGTLSISGNYYNVIIEGSSAVQGSISYPIDGLIDPDLNEKKVVVTGYAIGVSSGKYLNTMATSVVEATSASTRLATTRVSEVAANASALYRYDGKNWEAYKNDDAKVAVVTPDVYASLGTSSISEPEAVLPLFLANKYPYALTGDKIAVVYMKSSSKAAVMEFTKSEAGWIETPTKVAQTVVLTKDADGITAKISVYLDKSLLGDEGGFTAYNVVMTGGLSYVWQNTSSYGWKASSYYNSTNNEAESWLLTPSLDFTKGTAPVLSFEECINYLNSGDKEAYCAVKISTDFKNDVTKATWEQLTLPVRADGASWNYVNTGDIDLSKYIGNKVSIAFVYKVPAGSTIAPTWEFKNILVKEVDAK